MKTLGRWSIGAACSLAIAGCSASGSAPRGGGSELGGTGGGAVTGAGGAVLPSTGTGGDLGTIIGPSSGGSGSGGGGGADAGTTAQSPQLIDQCGSGNPAGLGDADVQKLVAGAGGSGGMRFLYPYAGTVFPRGLIAPLLMWEGGGAADAVYVHLVSGSFEYKGCLAPTAQGQLQLPQEVWDEAATHTRGASDPYTLEISVISSGTVAGPITEKITIATATLKGSIFYNSYSSVKAAQAGGFGGAVLRISPGKEAEVFLGQTGCTGCHSVSANGSRLITDAVLTGAASYALTPGIAVNPPPVKAVAAGTFTGIYPDGSLFVSNAHPPGMGTRTTGLEDSNAGLFETDTGTAVAGSGIPTGAMTPSFSPDGTLLTFNDYAIDNGHGLALMSFDRASRTATKYQKVYSTPDTTRYPGWPFVLPDDKAIVFALGSATDFTGLGAGLLGVSVPGLTPVSDLFILDVASGQSRILANAMGFASEQDAASATTYLPFGAAELHQNFYPTVSPVAAGGYFWVFFDSVRHYGNLGQGRQLWGTAVEISPDGTYANDPSHPAFYLSGQEFGTGNHRAFTALDPCREGGAACTTGIDCCGGFCTNGTCGKPPPSEPQCAHTDESCASGMPCCTASDQCIGGYCGQLLIQ